MVWLRELWASVRDAAFVAAQVVTLGVLALVLGLLALNVLTQRPPPRPSPSSQPSRPLAALVPTLVPDTPTPPPSPSAEAASTPTARPTESPAAQPTRTPEAAPPPVATQPPAPPPSPTRPPEPAATATLRPAPPTPTSAVAGQLIKVLPTADGLPARVRAEPSAKAPILVRVPLGSTVEMLGTTNGEELQPGNARWVRIKWRGTTGYVYSTLVGEPSPAG
jgi:hypothetical protein